LILTAHRPHQLTAVLGKAQILCFSSHEPLSSALKKKPRRGTSGAVAQCFSYQ
jgi:hypothetical protein